jgi:hypothetical protein
MHMNSGGKNSQNAKLGLYDRTRPLYNLVLVCVAGGAALFFWALSHRHSKTDAPEPVIVIAPSNIITKVNVLPSGKKLKVSFSVKDPSAVSAENVTNLQVWVNGQNILFPEAACSDLHEIHLKSGIQTAEFANSVCLFIFGGGTNDSWRAKFIFNTNQLVERDLVSRNGRPSIIRYPPPPRVSGPFPNVSTNTFRMQFVDLNRIQKGISP